MTALSIGILTDHPFSAHLVERLHAASVPLAVAALNQHDLVAGSLAQRVPHAPVTPLGQTGGWRQALADWIDREQIQAVFVLSFAHRIPEQLLKRPVHGFWNFHPGPLPDYRGADPVFWLILEGARHGGLTVHRMDPDFDTGPIFQDIPVPLSPRDTHGTHLDALGRAAAEVGPALFQAIQQSPAGSPPLRPQQHTGTAARRRPQPADTCCDWHRDTASHIARLARATNPTYGGAKFLYAGEPCQIFDAVALPEKADTAPGTFALTQPDHLTVTCAEQSLLRLFTIGTAHGIFHAPSWFAEGASWNFPRQTPVT
ncbi:MAG: methionyl-tRNA formyltransferase [Opitutales bacterium]